MNDYKALIEELRAHCICITDGENCGNCEGLIPEKSYCHLQIELHKNSADAIEQLVRERDAAVKCLPQRCTLCKHYTAEDGACYDERKCADWACHPNWEWRGVQNADS